jgi:hypothetical protein
MLFRRNELREVRRLRSSVGEVLCLHPASHALDSRVRVLHVVDRILIRLRLGEMERET